MRPSSNGDASLTCHPSASARGGGYRHNAGSASGSPRVRRIAGLASAGSQMTVECSNCGGLDSPELWVAAAALVVALASALWARKSAKAADESVALTRQEVEMARDQYDVFMREVRARARI